MSATSTFDPRTRAALNRLSGLRWLAAVHLYVFHLRAVHQAGRTSAEPPPFSVPLFDMLPSWLDRVCERGYCATSLFFLLSGFTLRWLYVDAGGRLTVEPRQFWWARLTRLFPLHVMLLLLIAPLVFVFASGLKSTTFFGQPVSAMTYLAIGFALSATLTQAWFPEYALSWNFPTWALSNVAFFYAVFPWTARRLQRMSLFAKRWLLWAIPPISLVPSAIHLWVAGEDRQMTFDGVEFWKQFANEFVMRNPGFWWPHFVLGMLLAEFTRHVNQPALAGSRSASDRVSDQASDRASDRVSDQVSDQASDQASGSVAAAWVRWFSIGDVSVIVLAAILAAPESIWSEWLGLPAHWLRLMLRHGLLAPLFLALVGDLAAGRGIMARLFDRRWLAKLGDASFSLFMWQLPMIAFSPLWKWLTNEALGRMGLSEPSQRSVSAIASFALLLTATTLVALGSASVERRVTRWLRS